jgi:hypothetical protein
MGDCTERIGENCEFRIVLRAELEGRKERLISYSQLNIVELYVSGGDLSVNHSSALKGWYFTCE